MTLIEAAQALGVDPQTLRTQAKRGRIQAVKVGRDWHISTDEVERYRRESLSKPGRRAVP